MGLATLTKGIIGLAIPAFTIFLYLLIRKELRSILKMQIIPGIFIFSLIALPWYITEWCLHGEKFREFALGFLFLSRFGGVVSGHPGPWYYYFIALLLGFAPWSHLLPFALIRIFQLRNEKPELFSLCYVIPVFLVFSIAKTKLPSYILPLYPSFAIMVGKLWDDFLGKEQPSLRRGMTIAHLFLGIVAALIMIGFYLVGTSNYSSQYHEQLPELLLLAGILVIGSVFSIGFYFLRKYKLSFASVPIMVFVIALVLTTRTLPIVEGYKGEKELGQKVSQVIKENELIAAYNVGNRPGVVFYNSKPVVFLENEKELLAFLKKEKGYCFTTMPELEKIKARFRVLDQKGDLAVIY
jgi:4-amino-4-deoxy-L-arabinose transferase-like glycosyltransferase